jgi:hypothetical protein
MGSGSSAEYCLDGDFRKRPNDLDLWKEMIDPNEDKGQSPIGQRLVTTWATSNARRKPEPSTVGTVKGKKTYASCNLDIAARSRFMETGVKLNVTKTIRSSKTGMLLPREGTLVSVTENLGRTLLLVEFGDGQHEYLFEYKVELKNRNASRQQYDAGAVAHI